MKDQEAKAILEYNHARHTAHLWECPPPDLVARCDRAGDIDPEAPPDTFGRDDHQKACDYLNSHGDQDLSFRVLHLNRDDLARKVRSGAQWRDPAPDGWIRRACELVDPEDPDTLHDSMQALIVETRKEWWPQ